MWIFVGVMMLLRLWRRASIFLGCAEMHTAYFPRFMGHITHTRMFEHLEMLLDLRWGYILTL